MPRDVDEHVAESFHGLVDSVQGSDLAEHERKYQEEKEARARLFGSLHPGSLTSTQAFLPEERDNEKLKSQITKELDAQEAIKRAQEKDDAKVDGEFPPPAVMP